MSIFYIRFTAITRNGEYILNQENVFFDFFKDLIEKLYSFILKIK